MFVQLTKEFLGKPAGERIDVADADADQLIRQGWAQPVDDDVLDADDRAKPCKAGWMMPSKERCRNWLRKQAAARRAASCRSRGWAMRRWMIRGPASSISANSRIAVRNACQPGKRPG